MEENNKDLETTQDSQEEKDPAQVDYDQGKDLLQAGDEALAASCFHNALIGYEQDNNEKGIANASDQLGDICAARDEHEKAIEHYEIAQKYYIKIGLKRQAEQVENNINLAKKI